MTTTHNNNTVGRRCLRSIHGCGRQLGGPHALVPLKHQAGESKAPQPSLLGPFQGCGSTGGGSARGARGQGRCTVVPSCCLHNKPKRPRGCTTAVDDGPTLRCSSHSLLSLRCTLLCTIELILTCSKLRSLALCTLLQGSLLCHAPCTGSLHVLSQDATLEINALLVPRLLFSQALQSVLILSVEAVHGGLPTELPRGAYVLLSLPLNIECMAQGTIVHWGHARRNGLHDCGTPGARPRGCTCGPVPTTSREVLPGPCSTKAAQLVAQVP